uniref:D-alanine--D-alanine ligase n=1 Tax=Eiseniibacteriota bacterium TaxID=2212470 RepID=A0A832I5T6_UNCEI
MKVAVLMGGRSSEREISLRTGRGVAQALRNLGHEVTAVDAANGRVLPPGEEERAVLSDAEAARLPAAIESEIARADAVREAEIVVIALHGGEGENGTVQALLELSGKPYTGSGVLASALAMDKAMSKKVFERDGIPTPAWRLLRAGAPLGDFDAAALGGWPLVVKPNAEGSTVGLTIVTRPEDFPAALDEAARWDPNVLVERYIPGRELTVAVMGDEALPIVEIRPDSGHYDYEAKYTAGRSRYFCPADLPEPLAARIRDLGLAASRALGCAGVSRVDFRLDPSNEPWCLEVNTVPGMTPTSLVPMAAKARGLTYDQVVQRMLELAVEEWRRRHGRTASPPTGART